MTKRKIEPTKANLHPSRDGDVGQGLSELGHGIDDDQGRSFPGTLSFGGLSRSLLDAGAVRLVHVDAEGRLLDGRFVKAGFAGIFIL